MEKRIKLLIAVIVIGPAVYLFSQYNFLLFHLTIEFFSMLVGIMIFVIAIISQNYEGNRLAQRFGYGLFIVSVLIFLHTITYKGMNIIEGYDANLPTQFWVAANYIQSISLLLAICLVNKKINKWIFIIPFTAIGVALIYMCFARIFPVCFIADTGLTRFKIISEYVIVFIYVLSFICLLYKKKSQSNAPLIWAIVFFILAELVFTLYNDVCGILVSVGHYFRLVGLVILFENIIMTNIRTPYEMIFSELKEVSEKDDLTKLFNRRYLKNYLKNIESMNKETYMVFFDVDDFKKINDTYGHETGDEVLKEISDIVNSSIRETDRAIRYGGDEFILILSNLSFENAKKTWERINKDITNRDLSDHKCKLTVSAGFSRYYGEFEKTIKELDVALNLIKKSGKKATSYLT